MKKTLIITALIILIGIGSASLVTANDDEDINRRISIIMSEIETIRVSAETKRCSISSSKTDKGPYFYDEDSYRRLSEIAINNYDFINELPDEERYLLLDAIDGVREEIQKYAPAKGYDYDANGNLVVMEGTGEAPKSNAEEWKRRRGSVLYTDISKTYGFQHGHVALVSTPDKYVVEATITTNMAQVFERKYWYFWDYEPARKKAAIVYYSGASWAEYDKIVAYGKKKIGVPFGFRKPFDDLSEFYCSKLVWYAHKDAGKKLPGPVGVIVGNITITGVTPFMIYMDSKMILEKRFDANNAYNYKAIPGPY